MSDGNDGVGWEDRVLAGLQTIVTAEGTVSLSDAIRDAETPEERLSLQLGGMVQQRDMLQGKLHRTELALGCAAEECAEAEICPSRLGRCPTGDIDSATREECTTCWFVYLLEQAEKEAHDDVQ